MKPIAILLITSLSLTSVAGFAKSAKHELSVNSSNMRFLRALSLMAKEQKAQAYPLLEEIFENSSSIEDRSRAAVVLSYANNKELKNHKRHFYAEFYLDHMGAPTAASTKENDSLLRIAGDGYFDEAELDKASEYYGRLSRSLDAANVDYAQYKLGWIDLNRSEGSKAFNRWYERLTSRSAQSQSLRDSMVRDLGRSWAETIPPKAEQAKLVQSLSFQAEDFARFTDGIISGVRRMKKAEELDAFRASIFKTDYAMPVFSRMITQAIGFNDKPCSILDWLDGPIDFDKLDPKDGLSALNRCFKNLKEKNARDWKSSPIKERLIVTSKKFKAKGMARWARAEFFKEMEDETASCLEFLGMAREHFETQKSQLPADADPRLVVTCQEHALHAATNDKRTKEVAEQMASLVETYAGIGYIGKDQKNPYYSLIVQFQENETFREKFKESVLKKSELYKNTLFPSIVAGALKKEEQLENGEKLLAQYAPHPITFDTKLNEVWLEVLRGQVKSKIDKKEYLAAKNLLATYLPLEKELFARKVGPELWILWALAMPAAETVKVATKPNEKDKSQGPSEVEQLNATGRQVAKLFIESLTEDAPVERRDLALATALKFGEVESIWTKWAKKSLSQVADKSILSQFYQKTFDLLIDGKLQSRDLDKTEAGHLILTATQLAMSEKLDSGKVLKLESEDLELGDKYLPAFLKDFRKLAEYQDDQSKSKKTKLAFNSKLPQRIESRFGKLNKQIESFKAQTWSHPTLSHLAGLTVAQTCSRFISELEDVSHPRGISAENVKVLQDQIQSVIDLVKNWRELVLKTTARQKNS